MLLCFLVLTQPLIYFIPAAVNNSKRNFAASIPSLIVVQDNEYSSEDKTYNIDNATKLSTLESYTDVYDDNKVCTDQPACNIKEDPSVAGHYLVDLQVNSEEEEEEELIPEFKKMNVSTFKTSSFKTEYLFLAYNYIN